MPFARNFILHGYRPNMLNLERPVINIPTSSLNSQ